MIEFEKINRRNFEDAPDGSAIFEDTKMIKTSKKSNCLARERNCLMFMKSEKRKISRMSRAGTYFSKIKGATGSLSDPSSKSTLRRNHLFFLKINIERRLFQDVSSESAILVPNVCATEEHAVSVGDGASNN